MTQAYPLQWPAGVPRARQRLRSKFDITPDRARRYLEWEVERMGGRHVVISTNLPLRQDGKPYANAKADQGDVGVAVYFLRRGKQMVFACDKWDKVEDNMRAIEKTIDALRGIERWGSSDAMERAFTGFEALPPASGPRDWRDVLQVTTFDTFDVVKAAYRERCKVAHPDVPTGSTAAFQEVQAAWEAAKTHFGKE